MLPIRLHAKGESMDKKKKWYSEAQNKATQKYIRAHYDNIVLRVPKGKKEEYKDAAAAVGMSLNAFAVAAIDEKIERDI